MKSADPYKKRLLLYLSLHQRVSHLYLCHIYRRMPGHKHLGMFSHQSLRMLHLHGYRHQTKFLPPTMRLPKTILRFSYISPSLSSLNELCSSFLSCFFQFLNKFFVHLFADNNLCLAKLSCDLYAL